MSEKFLDHGFVELIDKMGNDYRILQAARVSTGSIPIKGGKKDKGLIRYLYKNQHMSPFEQVVLTFHAKIPNFVMKQLLRHRTFSFNEYSQRYSEVADTDYYVPDQWRQQGLTNHQGSGQPFDEEKSNRLTSSYKSDVNDSFAVYEGLLHQDVAKELARINLPSSTYTQVYFTTDLRNLFHFLELRLHEHAQFEMRAFAQSIFNILERIDDLKWSVQIFVEMTELNWQIKKMLSRNIQPEDITQYLIQYKKK